MTNSNEHDELHRSTPMTFDELMQIPPAVLMQRVFDTPRKRTPGWDVCKRDIQPSPLSKRIYAGAGLDDSGDMK